MQFVAQNDIYADYYADEFSYLPEPFRTEAKKIQQALEKENVPLDDDTDMPYLEFASPALKERVTKFMKDLEEAGHYGNHIE